MSSPGTPAVGGGLSARSFIHDESTTWTPSEGAPHEAPQGAIGPQGIVEAQPLVGQRFDQYQIEALIGQGGFGAVYRARQENLQRFVALKVMHGSQQSVPNAIERFRREAQTMARVRHPNIVQLYDFGWLDGHGCYMAMEYLEGETLTPLLQKQQPWQLSAAEQVLVPLCDALACVHTEGIVHRDLKPSNIFLAKQSSGAARVKLLDFGIAALSDGSSELTSTGAFLGTAQYVAPEQARGAKELDHRADLYALGALLYQLLTGRLLFEAESRIDMILKHVQQRAPALAHKAPWTDWHPTLEMFLARALAKDPGLRPPDAHHFSAQLQEALQAQRQMIAQGATVQDENIWSGQVSQQTGALTFAQEALSIDSTDLYRSLTEAERANVGKSARPLPTATGATLPLPTGVHPQATERNPGISASPAASIRDTRAPLVHPHDAPGEAFEREDPTLPKGALAHWWLWAGVLLGLLLLAWWWSSRGPTPAHDTGQDQVIRGYAKGLTPARRRGSKRPTKIPMLPPLRPPQPARRAPHKSVRWTIRTSPRGVQVWRRGVRLGQTPLTLRGAPGQAWRLRLQKRGYRTRQVRHTLSRRPRQHTRWRLRKRRASRKGIDLDPFR